MTSLEGSVAGSKFSVREGRRGGSRASVANVEEMSRAVAKQYGLSRQKRRRQEAGSSAVAR